MSNHFTATGERHSWNCSNQRTSPPVLRENFVPNDSVGFSTSGDPSCRHEDSAHDDGPAISILGSFRMAGPGSLGADSHLTTAARGVQAQVEEALAEKQDGLFWSLLSKIWRDWRSELILVKPETVIRWRERKFREF
jgi:hypothetical protein